MLSFINWLWTPW